MDKNDLKEGTVYLIKYSDGQEEFGLFAYIGSLGKCVFYNSEQLSFQDSFTVDSKFVIREATREEVENL